MRSHVLQAVKEEARISLRDAGYKLFSYVSWWLASDCSLIEMLHMNHTRYLFYILKYLYEWVITLLLLNTLAGSFYICGVWSCFSRLLMEWIFYLSICIIFDVILMLKLMYHYYPSVCLNSWKHVWIWPAFS